MAFAATGSAVGAAAGRAADDALHQVLAALDGRRPDLVVAFVGAAYAPETGRIGARILERLQPGHLVGTTAGGVIAGPDELERGDCLALWAAVLPGAEVAALHYPPPSDGPGEAVLPWPEVPDGSQALVAFADPFTFPADGFLQWLEQTRPGVPVAGGLASAGGPGRNRLLLDDAVLDRGGVAVALGGDIRLRTLVSQGCRPIGHSYTVTRAERNVLQELGGVEPVERIRQTFAGAGPDDRRLMREGLHVGTAIDEYRDELTRGDFLVRQLLGGEPGTGAVVLGDVVQVGQTVQFHVRDAASADEDLRLLLEEFRDGGTPAAALLFTCNGRGSRLFGEPDHDARLVRQRLGEIPLAGFFCAGEFGRVGRRSFLHGFTASLLAVDGPGVTQQ